MSGPTEATLAEILTLVLERPVAPAETVLREAEPKWDSLKHIEIVMAVEAAFGVSFSAEEMGALTGSADILQKIGG